MEQNVLKMMLRIVDDHIRVDDLNRLLHGCIRDKAEGNGIWADLTAQPHRMYGGSLPELERLAADTELLMLGLDVMDDLQDQDNRDKIWMQASHAVALNAVMALLMAALSDIAAFEARYVRRTGRAGENGSIAAKASRFVTAAINGQQRDITNAVETEEDYVRMVDEKSGSLIRLACYLGYSFAAELPASEQERWEELAGLIGFMAQLHNDMRDVQRWDVKNDLIFKRKTLPVLYLLSYSEEDFPPLLQYYDGQLTKDQFLKHKRECISFIHHSGCLEYSRAVMLVHLERAGQVLDGLDADPEAKKAFAELAFAEFR
jgi:competence protein ComQ